jgi:hypothetical protein
MIHGRKRSVKGIKYLQTVEKYCEVWISMYLQTKERLSTFLLQENILSRQKKNRYVYLIARTDA